MNPCSSVNFFFVFSGPTNEELTVAKRILRFTIKSLYSSKLELAMLKSRHVDASHLCPKSAVVRTSIEGASKEESDTTPFGGCEVCFHIYQSSAAVNSGQNRSSAGMDPLQMSLAEALTLVPLTGSPIIQYSLPFLEYNKTEHSKRKLSANSILFPFDPSGIPSDLSACLASTNRRKSSKLVHSSATEMPLTSDCVSEDHPFLRMKMTRRASDPSLRRILAQYRAEGAELMRRQLEMKRGTSAGGPRKTSRKNESLGNRSLDVLDPLRHSHIDVLFCSFSNEATNFCLSPKYYGIVYYDGVHDRSLEDFLNDFCFTNAICRSKPAVCTAPFVNHIRRFVHGFACVEISMETIEVAVDGSLEASMGIDEILTWDWCYGCKTASTPTSMGSDFRNLSIGRYVEYLCSATYLQAPKSNSECRHCLFHNHWQYFALGNFVACFKVFPVNPQEIILPPTVCEMGQNLVSVTSLIDQAKVLLEISGRMFTVMLEQLCALNSIPDLSPWLGTRFSDVVDDLKVIAEEQQSHFRAVIGLLQETLTQFEPSVFLGEFSPEYLHCQDLIVRCRFILHTACSQWNDCRTDFISFAKKQKPLAPPVEDKPREKTKEKIKTSQEDLISSEMESSSDPTATPPHTGYIVDMTESANENLNESPIVHQAGSISQSTTGVSKKPTVNDISASRTFTSISEKFGIANLSATIETISPPFESFEHFGLPVSKTVPVGVSEAEISSVVAYSLSSSDYIAKLRDLRNLLVDQGVGISLRVSFYLVKWVRSNQWVRNIIEPFLSAPLFLTSAVIFETGSS